MNCLWIAAALVMAASAEEKPNSPAVQEVFVELGLSPDEMVLKAIPDKYKPDEVTAAMARKDPKKYPFRAVVVAAAETLKAASQFQMMTELSASKDFFARAKAVAAQQEPVAVLILTIEESLSELDIVAAQLKTEKSPRWQAHYHYLSARLKSENARVQEYNFMLGKVRTDTLVELDEKAGQNGWKLGAMEKMQSSKSIRDLATQAAKQFEAIETDYPETPWAKLAERDRVRKAGLAWEPAKLEPKP